MKCCIAILCALLSGCATTHNATILSSSLKWGADAWEREAVFRFGPNVHVVICHGYDDGRWMLAPDDLPDIPVEREAETLHERYPDDPCVIFSCNVGNEDLHVPGIWYAHGFVSASPIFPCPGAVCSIFQFVSSK